MIRSSEEFRIPDCQILGGDNRNRKVDMGKACAVSLLFLMMTSVAWSDGPSVTPPAGNWNKVQSLPQNANIMIELKGGGEISGEFIRLTENSIFLMEYERERSYPKGAIAQVTWMRPGSRARNAAIIGGIFFGIGFGLGYATAPYAADQDNLPARERAAVAGGVGGLLGGAAAAISLVRHPGPRSEVIYRAR